MSARTRSIIVRLAAVAVGLTLWRRRAQHARLSPAAPPLDLAVLACPGCHGHLALAGTSKTGTLTCKTCGRQYPIVAGISHFIEPATLTGLNRRFAYACDWFSWFYRLFCRVAFACIGMPEGAARREVLDRLEPRGGSVLEVSIGPEVNLPYLIGRPDVGEVHGFDISQRQLRRCQSYLQRQGWTVPLYLGDGEELRSGTILLTRCFISAASTSSTTRPKLLPRWSAWLNPARASSSATRMSAECEATGKYSPA